MLISRLAAKMQHIYYIATLLLVFGMDINDYPGTTAIWVSLEGCYISLRHNSSRNMMPKNGPRQCFDACPNSTYIGLQGSWCMCDTVGENFALPRYCNSTCSGETDMICGAGPGIAVYRKAYITLKCVYERTLETWFKARDKFLSGTGSKFLLPEKYVRNDICPPQTNQGFNIDSGEFWIGLIWITTDTTTTSMNTMAMISTHLPKTSSTPATTAITTTPILTEHQSTKISAASSSTIVSTTMGSSPPVNPIAVYIAVPVGVCVVSVVVLIICWCQKFCCFRSCREGVQTSEIKNNSQPEIPYMDPLIDVNVSSNAPSGSNRATFQGYQENIIPLVSGQTDIHEGHDGGSNAEHYYRDINSSTPNHLESRSVKPENSFALHDGINSSMSKREKGKRKRKKKNKEDHIVRAANENGEIDGNTDNRTELGRDKNGDHSVPKERTENPNDESRYDEQKGTEKEKKLNSNKEQSSTSSKNEFYRDSTVSDIQAMFPPVQEQDTDGTHGSDELHTELNTSNSESRIEETKRHKRPGKRKKIKTNSVFDVPADHPVVEEQTDINKPGSRIN